MGHRTALVTGGSGYFGSLLIEKLRGRGIPCRSFDLVPADDRPGDVEFVQGDIRDPNAVATAVRGIDTVHHNVAQVPIAKNRALFRSVNVLGTQILLRAALEAGVRKVIYTSSSAIYAAHDTHPVNEETPPAPAEAYGRTKVEAENLCHDYAGRGLDVTIVRPRTILGPGRLGIFQILFEWIREGANVPVLGKGDNRFQFVHPEDLAEACILAARRPGPTSYNCGTDRFGTLREGLEHLCRYAGTGARVRSVPMTPAVWAMQLTSTLGLSPLGPYHAVAYGRPMYFDITKCEVELGWHPKYSNNEMFVQGYDWYFAHREEVMRWAGPSGHRSALRQGILRLVKTVL